MFALSTATRKSVAGYFAGFRERLRYRLRRIEFGACLRKPLYPAFVIRLISELDENVSKQAHKSLPKRPVVGLRPLIRRAGTNVKLRSFRFLFAEQRILPEYLFTSGDLRGGKS